ncbi:MAG: aldo/keto reductase [Paracoccaceae bacterium]
MKRIPLGRTGIDVPDLCLGTMTFGTHTPEAEAHAQLDMAMEAGLDFCDVAEMYPVIPVTAETAGMSEEVVGTWVAKSGEKGRGMRIATKVTGDNGGMVRDGRGYGTEADIREAVEGSLRRLQVERIDLYQTHWPMRGSYHFRQNWRFDPRKQDSKAVAAHMEMVLDTMDALVREGKIAAWGLSNESAWGTAQWLHRAASGDRPRVASIQNEYSLLCRLYDTDLAELGHHEDVVLLAFSPLGTGYLTGKYQNGAVPEGSRKSHESGSGGRASERIGPAVDAYLDIARDHGLDPVHMSLAWCRQRPFPVSAIFGATRLDQLRHVLDGADLTLSDEVLRQIDRAHRRHPMPY